MLLWGGVTIAIAGALLSVLSRLLLGPRAQRVMNQIPANLQRMIESGEARQFGERAEEFFREAIAYQLEHQVGPVPLARPGLLLLGILLSLAGYLIG